MDRRAAALAEAAREITRLELEGFGLFRIAEMYEVEPVRFCSNQQAELDVNYQALPAYLQGSPGILTWRYVQERLADQVEEIWGREDPDLEVTYFRRSA